MKVKIGDIVYDSKDEPIMVILSPTEKRQIATMPPSQTKFLDYPHKRWGHQAIKEWVDQY